MQTEVLTNNPDIQSLIPEGFLFTRIDGSSRDVLTAVRDRIHLGAKLLAHPMAGRLRPNETPFATAVLRSADPDDPQPLDLASLEIIEYCLAEIRKYEDLPKKYDGILLPDLRFIDCQLFQSILQELNVR